MTVESIYEPKQFSGNGIATTFSFPYYVEDEAFVSAVHTDTNGDDTTLTLNTDFSVADVGEDAGVTVTFPLAGSSFSTLAAGEKLTLNFDLDILQETDLENYDELDADTYEKALDRVTRICQMLRELIGRCPALPVSLALSDLLLPTPEAGRALAWNGTADGLENTDIDVSNLGATAKYQRFLGSEGSVAADGKTTFSLSSWTYTPSARNLVIYQNGALVDSENFTRTSTSTFTFHVQPGANDVIEAFSISIQAAEDLTAATNAAEAAQTAAENAQTSCELARTATETARDTTLGYRNEAEVFKDDAEAAAVEAASAVGYKMVPTEQTISFGAITISSTSSWTCHTLDGEGDTADILDTINGGTQGQRVTFQLENTARPITIEPSATIKMAANFTMNNLADRWEVEYDSSLLAWVEINRANNG